MPNTDAIPKIQNPGNADEVLRMAYDPVTRAIRVNGVTPAGLTALYALVASGAPVNGVTGAGVSPEGSFYYDTAANQYYINTGTIGVPEWRALIQA